MARSYLVSVPELAQIARLPAAGAIPRLEWAGARTVSSPRLVPTVGKVLGQANHGGWSGRWPSPSRTPATTCT
jgi:hypothetical protein